MQDNFFCFDSDNLETAVTRLYGYGLCEDGIIIDGDGDYSKLSSLGAYVLVDANEDVIAIYQDYLGSFGLYYYSEDDYFAISNSFLMLMEYLRDNHRKITFNKHYADYFIACELASNLSSETLINEIEMLPKDLKVSINKKTKEITFTEIELTEYAIPVNSKEALDILDGWFYRWVEILRSIRKGTNNMIFDLSGGFDSRLAAVIWLNANMDLSKLRIFSFNTPRFEEEFSIASDISDIFGFNLNNDVQFETSPIDFKEFMINSEYVKFGFEKERFLYDFTYKKPFFRISGHCGEILRVKHMLNMDEYVDSVCNHAYRLEPSLKPACEFLLNREIEQLYTKYDFPDKNSRDVYPIMYKQGRCRHHYGKEFADSFLVNRFTIPPLSDPELQRINFKIGIDDDNLLAALIFKRYCPALLDVDFCGGKRIKQETLDFCDEINSIKEFVPRQYEFIEGPDAEIPKSKQFDSFRRNLDYIFDAFTSRQFKKEFEKHYPEEMYNRIRMSSVKFRKNSSDIIAVVEVIKAIHDVEIANLTEKQDFNDWVGGLACKDKVEWNEVEAAALCDMYVTSRIDIKNRGGYENGIEIAENSDESSTVSFPKWMSSDEGNGCIIKSKGLKMDLKVKSIGDGELSIDLRGQNVLDRNKKRFPVYINYTNFTVDGKEIFNESRLLTHDDSYSFRMPVKDSQIIDVHVKWMPFSSSCEYENKRIASLERKIKELEAEKRDLESKASKNKFSKLISKL